MQCFLCSGASDSVNASLPKTPGTGCNLSVRNDLAGTLWRTFFHSSSVRVTLYSTPWSFSSFIVIVEARRSCEATAAKPGRRDCMAEPGYVTVIAWVEPMERESALYAGRSAAVEVGTMDAAAPERESTRRSAITAVGLE
eukprot:6184828-Pleurochrysis_carterae.AAC.3